ncbi:MAG: hypothetical protein GSR78_00545 [Desulfurococcales archaeon]|nr:hypothetical protein [Desulfurococcales archaeon]
MQKRRPGAPRRILLAVLVLARIIVLVARLVVRYLYVRIKLAAWRRVSVWRLKRRLRGLPPGLREEIVEYYKDYTAGLAQAASIRSLLGGRRRRKGGLPPGGHKHEQGK